MLKIILTLLIVIQTTAFLEMVVNLKIITMIRISVIIILVFWLSCLQMSETLFFFPTRKQQKCITVVAYHHTQSLPHSPLHIYDVATKINYLIESGTDVSALTNASKLSPSTFCLIAANNTKIATHGQKLVEIELNFWYSFKWEFILADVKLPIIKLDFLAHSGLLNDLKNHCFIDPLTN